MLRHTADQFRPLQSIPGVVFVIAMVAYVAGAGILWFVPLPGLEGWDLIGAFVVQYLVTGIAVWLSTLGTVVMAYGNRAYLWLLLGQVPACIWFSGIWVMAFNLG